MKFLVGGAFGMEVSKNPNPPNMGDALCDSARYGWFDGYAQALLDVSEHMLARGYIGFACDFMKVERELAGKELP